MPLEQFGTAFGHGVSVYTGGGSAVSAYGPIIGADVAVVALTVPATLNARSVDSVIPLAGAAVGDGVIIHPPSALSAGVTAFGFVNAADNVTLRLSASGATAAQTAQTWGISLIRRSFMTSIR